MSQTDNAPVVLVVDDHHFSRTIFTRILTEAGFAVETAGDGLAALERIETLTPDAFIIDVGMPRLDGIELCRRLRAQPRFRATPLLITTAADAHQVIVDGFDAGCDDVIAKPLEPAVVASRLRGLVDKAVYFRELETIRAALAHYVSPRVRHLIERHLGETPALIPEEKQATVLFTDIRDFTALSRGLAPTALFTEVSEQLGRQVAAVYAHGGYVDKFAGDGIMAVFDGADMVSEACTCALAIMAEAGRQSTRLDAERVPLGIGIATGAVVVGNIGSGEHLDYSVIGQTVNLAARLSGYAGALDTVVSPAVQAAAGERFRFGAGEQARIRGLEAPLTVYRLLAH